MGKYCEVALVLLQFFHKSESVILKYLKQNSRLEYWPEEMEVERGGDIPIEYSRESGLDAIKG